MKKKQKYFCAAIGLFALFVLWTVLVSFVNIAPIGPNGSCVGFADLNGAVHKFTGVHMSLYMLTDWLGLVPIGVAIGFAIFGLLQWIRRKNILKVDRDIITLGIFYVLVLIVYVFFEFVVINYRPILINGYLEVSYPSSTTVLVMCVMPTLAIQLKKRIKNKVFSRCIIFMIFGFVGFMVIGRLASGVHWFTDIFVGALISASLVSLYVALQIK